MSATKTRSARADRTQLEGAPAELGDEAAKKSASNAATPALFATSGTPPSTAMDGSSVDPDRGGFEGTVTMTLSDEGWTKFWAAADSGKLDREAQSPAADRGESERDSLLNGLLERFDDDERWRELARTGRAL